MVDFNPTQYNRFSMVALEVAQADMPQGSILDLY